MPSEIFSLISCRCNVLGLVHLSVNILMAEPFDIDAKFGGGVYLDNISTSLIPKVKGQGRQIKKCKNEYNSLYHNISSHVMSCCDITPSNEC